MTPLTAPEIEQITWRKQDTGVTIRLNTNVENDTEHLLWQYEEDWVYRSAITTSYAYNPITENVEEVLPENNVSRCWNQNRVQRILIESISRHGGGQVADRELALIPNNSEKLGIRYSILVKQMAISKEAFDFWEIMRKNTEDIGGIFSP